MTSLKTKLNQHDDTMMNHIQIDSKFKQQLHTELTKQANASQPRQWWKFLIPTLSISAVAAVAIIIGVNNKPIIKQALLPQEALAAALSNVFTLDSIDSTLGLTSSDQLHHRQLHYTQEQTADIDLWTQQNNFKFAVNYSDPTNHDVITYNAVKQMLCENSICNDFATVQKIAQQQSLSNQGMFYPIDKEQMISDLSVESFIDTMNGPGVYVTWSTTTPIVQGQFMSTDAFFVTSGGSAITDYTSHGMHWYTNEQHDGKYWHRMPVYHDIINATDNAYIQIQEVNNTDFFGVPNPALPTSLRRASMIYTVHFSEQTITAVSPELVAQEIDKSILSNKISQFEFYQLLQPALYMMRHVNDLGDPITTTTTAHDQTVKMLEYTLPDSYLAEVRTSYSGPHDSSNKVTMDIYLDQTQTEFLGYTVKENGIVLEELWMTDEILPNDQAETIFAPTTN